MRHALATGAVGPAAEQGRHAPAPSSPSPRPLAAVLTGHRVGGSPHTCGTSGGLGFAASNAADRSPPVYRLLRSAAASGPAGTGRTTAGAAPGRAGSAGAGR